jgi:hypothetical protein
MERRPAAPVREPHVERPEVRVAQKHQVRRAQPEDAVGLDRFVVPLPFSRGVFVWGAPIQVPRDADDATLEACRLRVEAETYSNDILPRARGTAQRQILDAEAYRQRVVADAEGESSRFAQRAAAYEMRAVKVDGQDVERVYAAAHDALAHVRAGNGPVFLDIETFRMHGHYIGDPQVYRSKEDRAAAAERDPVIRLRERLDLGAEDWEELEAEVREIVEASVEYARNGTDPQPEDALKNVYA